ncbi:hypothetical protein IDM40_01215 [Nocardiopsis sp. HNM0947]|uniref:DUF2567 domain-containing protein n=1 Tax=Nocardiopsis coralli TaxID=2772213 RepID=A0ABR9P0E7_9ACTN|nr:hypothetical protein [Nocardiopsis coralli]MBE2997325.1 hypothetical protein [Nocardiopsis coralli]
MTDQSLEGRGAPARALVVALVIFAAIAVAGALLGLLWWGLAPRPEGTSLGDGEVFTGTTEDVFAGEGYFLLMTAIAGLVTGYAAYMVQFPLARRRVQDLRLPALLAGVLGSAAGSLSTLWVGTSLDRSLQQGVAEASPGESVTVALQLDATAFLVAWPFVFVLQYALLDAVSMVRRDLPGSPEAAPLEQLEPLPVGEPGTAGPGAGGTTAEPGGAEQHGSGPEDAPPEGGRAP